MTIPASPPEQALPVAIERIWEVLPPAWNQIRANVRAIACDRFGISVQQFRILRLIGRGTCSVSELASTSLISRPAVSQCVDGLVERGLVSREQSERDRRRIKLALTPKGADALAVVFEENRCWMAQRLASLSPEEMGSIIAGMQALRRAIVEG